MSKFLSISIIIILGLLLISAAVWLKKVDTSRKEGPLMESMKVCEFVSYNAPCEKDDKNIPQSNGDIYATIDLKNITNSQLTTKWYYVQGKTKSVIGEGAQTVYSNGVVQLKLEKDLSKGWLIGDYIVQAQLDNGNSLSEEFKIVGND